MAAARLRPALLLLGLALSAPALAAPKDKNLAMLPSQRLPVG